MYTLYTGESNVTHCAVNPAGVLGGEVGGGVTPVGSLYIFTTMTSH